MPTALFYNYGKAGGGNQYIANMVVQCNMEYNFCETDLVIVMWSTFAREDRYINGNWITPGNIFTQNEYPDDYVKKYADIRGYMIRDIATIELLHVYLGALTCTAIPLLSVPFIYDSRDLQMPDVLLMYKKTTSRFTSNMYDLLGSMWAHGHTYSDPNFLTEFGDYHPNPRMYKDYLINAGFELTHDAINYADNSTDILKQCRTKQEINVASFGLSNLGRKLL